MNATAAQIAKINRHIHVLDMNVTAADYTYAGEELYRNHRRCETRGRCTDEAQHAYRNQFDSIEECAAAYAAMRMDARTAAHAEVRTLIANGIESLSKADASRVIDLLNK